MNKAWAIADRGLTEALRQVLDAGGPDPCRGQLRQFGERVLSDPKPPLNRRRSGRSRARERPVAMNTGPPV